MQESAQDVVFTIPELVALIAQYLSPRDTSQWMMTCKTFSRQLEPLFWSHPVVMRTTRDPSSLVRHTHHFRSLIIEHDLWLSFIKDAPPSPSRTTSHGPSVRQGFPRLRKLTVYANRDDVPLTPNFVLALCQSLHLTDLSIQYPFRQEPLFMELILASLATGLPCLQRLLIELEEADPATGFRLLDLCFKHPQLIDLQCDFPMYEERSITDEHGICDPRFATLLKSLQDMDKARQGAGRPTGLHLKSLSLPYIEDGYPKDFLIPFLKLHVPNLERWRIVDMHTLDTVDVQGFKEAIATGCPGLQHLSSHSVYMRRRCNTLINATIRSVTKASLRSYRFKCFSNSRHMSEDSPVIRNLLEHHASTLEEIEFLEFFFMKSEDLQSIFTTCKHLRTLRMEQSDTISSGSSLEFGHVFKEWACRDITVLHLWLNRKVVVPEGWTEDEVVDAAAQTIYSQIGRLFKLEELALGWPNLRRYLNPAEKHRVHDLTLEDGWLDELAGLKELRHFQMNTEYWCCMGQAELDFMGTNWPKLERISFDYVEWETQFALRNHWNQLKKTSHLDMSRITIR
ncbi:MAG: hypothetical protein J3Q66DRAFT_330721 [Benniella sp.]|nr:MAG: hypothetical protein J3Q66DRAFT_330721 [Benniella sp.]